MKREEVLRVILAAVIAGAFILTGVIHLPTSQPAPFRHPPVVVYSEPMLPPLIVNAQRALPRLPRMPSFAHLSRFPRLTRWSNLLKRAEAGIEMPVSLTQYCLSGTTRRDHLVRPGIVAADPRVFPLARYVEVFLGKRYLGRFLVDDTGGNVKGATLDMWTPSCSDARRFGRQWGTAMLVVKPER